MMKPPRQTRARAIYVSTKTAKKDTYISSSDEFLLKPTRGNKQYASQQMEAPENGHSGKLIFQVPSLKPTRGRKKKTILKQMEAPGNGASTRYLLEWVTWTNGRMDRSELRCGQLRLNLGGVSHPTPAIHLREKG